MRGKYKLSTNCTNLHELFTDYNFLFLEKCVKSFLMKIRENSWTRGKYKLSTNCTNLHELFSNYIIFCF